MLIMSHYCDEAHIREILILIRLCINLCLNVRSCMFSIACDDFDLLIIQAILDRRD